MTDLMKTKQKEAEQLKNQREKSKVDDMKTLKLYQSLDEGKLFSRTYEKFIAKATKRCEYDYKFQIEKQYGMYYKQINTSDSIDSKIEKYKKNNPLKIRR